jgi:hypothetical protein
VTKICQNGKPTRGRKMVPFHCQILNEHTHELPRFGDNDKYEIRLNRTKKKNILDVSAVSQESFNYDEKFPRQR